MHKVYLEAKGPDGQPIEGATVLAAYPDGRSLSGKTDSDGHFLLRLYRTDLEMTVLAAAEGYLPFQLKTVPGDRECVLVELEPSPDDRRAALFTKSAGHLKGLSGRIEPIRDPYAYPGKDGYLYADNIAIDGTLTPPAIPFIEGQRFEFLDIYGVETMVRFLVVRGQFSLIEYTEPTAFQGSGDGNS